MEAREGRGFSVRDAESAATRAAAAQGLLARSSFWIVMSSTRDFTKRPSDADEVFGTCGSRVSMVKADPFETRLVVITNAASAALIAVFPVIVEMGAETRPRLFSTQEVVDTLSLSTYHTIAWGVVQRSIICT